MHGKRLKKLLALLALLSFSSSVLAAMMSVPYGWYLEINAGGSKVTSQNFPGSPSSTSGYGGNVNLGYKFMPFVGLEIGVTEYNNINIKDNAGTTAGTIKTYSADLSIRAIVPFSDSGFEGVSKIGIERIYSHLSLSNSVAASAIGVTGSTHHSTTGSYIAIGGQYYFMPELAAIIQWSQAQGNRSTGTFQLLTIGINFIFD